MRRQAGMLYLMAGISLIIAFIFGSVHYIVLYAGSIKYVYVSAIFALPTISLACTLSYAAAYYQNILTKDKSVILTQVKKSIWSIMLDFAAGIFYNLSDNFCLQCRKDAL